MDNQEFLTVVGSSFKKFLETGSRSNEKLKILHGAIARDLKERLGTGYYVQSLGVGNGKEMKLDGRYIDKVVDITILKGTQPIAGIGVKFVMQNYTIQKWEEFTRHNSSKYITLSNDDIQTSIHTPTKTLLFVVHFPEIRSHVQDKNEYKRYYEQDESFEVCESPIEYGTFSSAVIHNDYDDFANKVVHYIKFL